VEIDEVLTKTS